MNHLKLLRNSLFSIALVVGLAPTFVAAQNSGPNSHHDQSNQMGAMGGDEKMHHDPEMKTLHEKMKHLRQEIKNIEEQIYQKMKQKHQEMEHRFQEMEKKHDEMKANDQKMEQG